jgi:hypothetical protein
MRHILAALVLGAAAGCVGAAQAQSNAVSSGTGFFVNADGWAVTNAHVLEGCTRAVVPTMGEARDWIVDRQNDLAAVRIAEGAGKPFLRLRGPAPRLGDDVAAFGYPFSDFLSDSIKVTTGNINSLIGAQNDTRFLQISTPLQPGNSGGPVVDRSGAVLGIATAVFSGRGDFVAQNVNFAIRSNVLEMFLQSRSIEYLSLPASVETLSTADLADVVSPAVMQIRCVSEGPAETAKTDRMPPVENPSAPGDFPREMAELFAYAYHDAWSSTNDSALQFMASIYTESIEFYGNLVSASSVMDEKRRFAQRWPIRDYSIRDGTLSIECTGVLCDVDATVDWFAHSPARTASSNGVATFRFRLNVHNLSIVRESGAVLKDQIADPSGMLARLHDQNGKCRGGAGDLEATMLACDAREHTTKSLKAAGWCFGRNGEEYFDMEWHRCGPTSLRE